MKKTLLSAIIWCAATGLALPAAAQTLDPSFAPGTYYASATAYSALEQADGKRIILGSFTRADGSAVNRVVRYTAAGAVDVAFQQNIGTALQPYRVAQLGNGQLLFTAFTNLPLVAGGVSRNGLLRLNADGTVDTSFDAGSGPSSVTSYNGIDYALPLPNGQILVGGYFDHFNGVAANNLVRLNADGSVDSSFSTTLGADDEIEFAAALPSGKYLVGGYTANTTTSTFRVLMRLNANGSIDNTFNANLNIFDDANYFLVQPDGKIVVAGYLTVSGANDGRGVVRLLPDGGLDNTFTTPPQFTNASVLSYYGKSLDLQPDGKLLVLSDRYNSQNATPSPVYGVVRLNTNGNVDGSYQTGSGANAALNSFTRLANGGVLTAGGYTNFNGALDRPVVQFTSTGAVDASFSPVLQTGGSVSTLVQQADGKLIIGGNFTEVNGQPARRLARLNPNGTLDASFAPGTGYDGAVSSLALQPDGRLLALHSNAVLRRLTSGALDNTFVTPDFAGSILSRLLLLPDGRMLVGGNGSLFLNGVSSAGPLVRLQANGSRDASFSVPVSGTGALSNVQSLALQPNGKVLVGGTIRVVNGSVTTTVRTVSRLESNGALDASFANTVFTPATSGGITTLALQPDGKVLAGGQFTAVSSTPRAGLARLNADGTHDTGFVPPFTSGNVNALFVQGNGRIVVAGSMRGPNVPNNLTRLLASGQLDASFGPTAVPNGTVSALLVQPDGNLVIAGGFTTIGGVASGQVARLLGTNVLHVKAPQAVADRTEAWPVPAHATLNVAPDASAHPQAVELLDLLGRPVLRQPLAGATPAVLPVQNLRAGIYLLRVSYAEGQVTRRVQVQ